MGAVTITATVDRGGEVADDIDAALKAVGIVMVVIHGPGCCAPCRGNEDWRDVPYPGCTGNIAGRYPESTRAAEVGNLCQCTVEAQEIPEGAPTGDVAA